MNSRILFFAIALSGLLINGCTKDPATSLYDPHYNPGAQPVITSISPEFGAYPISGVTVLDIHGSNFTSDTAKMVVFFDGVRAQILGADPTMIRVKTPSYVKDSIKVRIGIVGDDKFNTITDSSLVSVKPTIVNTVGIDAEKEKVWSVAADNHGNIFASLTRTEGTSDIGIGVVKLTNTGVRTQYANRGGEVSWNSMKFGSGDTLFAARGLKAVFGFNPNVVGTAFTYVSAGLGNIADFDFDQQKNIWAGGSTGTSLYRINRAKQVKAFPFVGIVRAVRVYNNSVYVGANAIVAGDTADVVYRFPINAADTSLGTPELYFNLKAQPGYQTAKITAITFDSDGKMYVGIDPGTVPGSGILVVSGANAAPEPLYGGMISSKVLSLHWGTDNFLYVVIDNGSSSKTPQVLLKVDMQRSSAPYYGRQ